MSAIDIAAIFAGAGDLGAVDGERRIQTMEEVGGRKGQQLASSKAWPRARTFNRLLLIALLLTAFGIRCQLIVDNSPYPRHVDEETFLKNSLHMLRDASARPMTLNWPTLPIYLATAAETGGYLVDRALGRGVARSDLRTSAFPYYEHPGPVLAARFLFAALSIGCMGFVGLIARKLTDTSIALVLAPSILSLNALFFYHSWNYLNVDIVGTFFITGGLAYLVCLSDDRGGLLHKAILPGIVCGLAAASKYTHAALALPFLISILAGDRKQQPKRILLLFFFLVVAFAAAMPYAVLEPQRLLAWISKQSEIYSGGWPGYTVEAGLPHLLRQMQHLIANYGLGTFAVGLIGLLQLLTRAGRKGWIVASYPIVFTLYFSMYRMDLVRNLLAVHVLYAVFATVGAVEVVRWSSKRLMTFGATASLARRFACGVVALAILAPAPWHEIRAAYFVPRDSRLQAQDWIEEHVDEGTRLSIARELGFDARALRKRFQVSQRPLARITGYGEVARSIPVARLRREADLKAYFLVPEYGFEFPWPERAGHAEALNARFSGGEVLAEFGSHPIPVEYFETVPRGDPKFSIRRGFIVGGAE